MGAVQVTVTIRNPADRDREWSGLFLVDTGATDYPRAEEAPRSNRYRTQSAPYL